MDLLLGGDLRYHICRRKTFRFFNLFSESETKYFIANILVGLDCIHQNGILHRDLKPENLVFDDKGKLIEFGVINLGHLRITDFGVARVWHPDNARDTSGTPGYMAPEVMCR